MDSMKQLTFLVDADMILFSACAATEQCIQWDEELCTIYTELTDAKSKFISDLHDYTVRAKKAMGYKGKVQYIMCISDRNNFRKLVLPTYKSNRTKRKPCGYQFLKEWVLEKYRCEQREFLEADDLIGILSGTVKDCCILSADKDMLTLPGRFYHFLKDEFYDTTEEQATYNRFYQTLKGDSTDGYNGCPGCGDVGARKILDVDCSWTAVVSAFEKKGLTEADALIQARVARILHTEDYNMETGEIYLWSPEGTKEILSTGGNNGEV